MQVRYRVWYWGDKFEKYGRLERERESSMPGRFEVGIIKGGTGQK